MSDSRKYQPAANPEYIAAMRGLRRSGATQPQESRNKRARTRQAAKARAIREDRL